MDSGLYIIRFSDGHYYGGRSVDIQSRIRNHLKDLRRGCHSNPHMQNVYNKLGTFVWEIYTTAPFEKHLELEQLWLDENCGMPGCLNIQRASTGSQKGWSHSMSARIKIGMRRGWNHSPETRAKIRQGHLGKKLSPEHIEKSRLANTGKTLSAEAREKVRLSSLGRRHSPESRAKISRALTGIKHSAETRLKGALARRGLPVSAEARKKISAALSGVKRAPLSDEHKKKISQANQGRSMWWGRSHSEASKLLISQAKKGKMRWMNKDGSARLVPTNEVEEFLQLGWCMGRIKR